MMEKIGSKIVRVICVILSGYLFLQGLFTLCNIRRVTEQNYFIRNNVLVQLAGIVIFFLLCRLILQEKIWKWLERWGEVLFWLSLTAMTMFMTWWILQTRFWYHSDTEKIYMCAGGLLEGDFSQWTQGGYAHRWPHQNGLILFVAILLKFWELDQTFLIFYFVSLFFYDVAIAGIYYTCRMLYGEKALAGIQGAMAALYFPYAFLVMKMYGDSIGYGMVVLAIYHGIRYLKENRKRNLILTGIFLGTAVCFKQNCLIVGVGILLLCWMDLFRQKKDSLKKFLLSLCFLGIALVISGLPKQYIEYVSGMKIAPGNSKAAHIAMGLQDSDKAPGWYNGYNERVFAENGYDRELTEKTAIEDIRKSVRHFVQDPAYGWQFFHHKLASEWNNPTFECFHIQNARGTGQGLSSFVKSVINDGGKANILLIALLDILEAILLFGILMYFLIEREQNINRLIWGILFIGAFFFWMFWEAKAAYVLPYFLFLIPYAFMGYRACLENWKNRRVHISLAVLALLIIGAALSNNAIITGSLKMNEDTEDYYEYIHEFNHNFMNFRF